MRDPIDNLAHIIRKYNNMHINWKADFALYKKDGSETAVYNKLQRACLMITIVEQPSM